MSRPTEYVDIDVVRRCWQREFPEAEGFDAPFCGEAEDVDALIVDRTVRGAFARGVRAGWSEANGRWHVRRSENHYHCAVCGRDSFPDYGRCAFCGYGPEVGTCK